MSFLFYLWYLHKSDYVLILEYKIKGGLGELGNLNFTMLEGDAEVDRILLDEE
jgi:hypothetical protein